MVTDSDQTVILDTMAGPAAHNEIVLGALRAQREGLATIILVGDAALLEDTIRQHGGSSREIECIHAPVFIGRRENASRALKLKTSSSLHTAVGLGSSAKTSVITFGNASALRRILATQYAPPGRVCPFLTTVKTRDEWTTLLDVGPHVDLSGQNLSDFAIIGSVFHAAMFGVDSPTIGLLSSDGVVSNCDETFREAHRLLNEQLIDYRGLMSGHDWSERPTNVAIAKSQLGSFLSQLSHAQMNDTESVSPEPKKAWWRGVLGRQKGQHVSNTRSIYPSSVILGADRLVVHRKFVASDTDIYRSIREAVRYGRLHLTAKIEEALKAADDFSMRMTIESPASIVR